MIIIVGNNCGNYENDVTDTVVSLIAILFIMFRLPYAHAAPQLLYKLRA